MFYHLKHVLNHQYDKKRSRNLEYDWNDRDWLGARGQRDSAGSPMSIYECHFGSWRYRRDGSGVSLGYRETADELMAAEPVTDDPDNYVTVLDPMIDVIADTLADPDRVRR